jgi:hypothetical protein
MRILLLFLLAFRIDAALLRLDVIDINGTRDISVTTQHATTLEELGWAEESFPKSVPRRCAMIPLRLTNPSNSHWQGLGVASNEHLFVTSPTIPGMVISNNVRVTIETEDGDIIRESEVSVPFLGLVKPDGSVGLAPGETVFAWAKQCRVDLSGIPRNRFFWIWVQFKHADGQANVFIPCVIGAAEVRQVLE